MSDDFEFWKSEPDNNEAELSKQEEDKARRWLSEFYQDKVLGTRAVVNRHNFSKSQVRNWIQDFDEDIQQENRLSIALGNAFSGNNRGYNEFIDTLEDEYSEQWVRDLERGVVELGESKEFRKLSLPRTTPSPDSNIGEGFRYILELFYEKSKGENLADKVKNSKKELVLDKEPHLHMKVSSESVMEDYDTNITNLHSKGLIGKLGDGRSNEDMEIYVSKDYFLDYFTVDTNPYTL